MVDYMISETNLVYFKIRLVLFFAKNSKKNDRDKIGITRYEQII